MNISFLKKIKNKKVKCGNSIAEIGGKFFFPSYFGNAIATFHFFLFYFFPEMICAPHFYNTSTTNFKRQVVIVGLKK